LKIESKYFGQVEYEPEELLIFPRGLFGFEDEREFLLIPFQGEGTLYSLQSVRTPGLAFVAVDPFSLLAGYAPVLQDAELRELGVAESRELFFYALVSVKAPAGDSTVNLRCPIAINGESRQAMQVILEDRAYGMRHLLRDAGRQEAEPC